MQRNLYQLITLGGYQGLVEEVDHVRAFVQAYVHLGGVTRYTWLVAVIKRKGVFAAA